MCPLGPLSGDEASYLFDVRSQYIDGSPVVQTSPVHPLAQLHWNLPGVLMQSPLFLHGWSVHSSLSVEHNYVFQL